MRRPSITIYLEDLGNILRSSKCVDHQELLNRIVIKSQESPVRRSVVLTNTKVKKSIERAATPSVRAFNGILEGIRMKRLHRGARQIAPGDKQYLMLCDITRDAEEFCELYGLSTQEGFKHYIEIGLDKIGRNYGLNKFKTHKAHIFETYERKEACDNDQNPDLTAKVASIYFEKVGLDTDEDLMMKSFEINQHNFVYAAEEILDNNADPASWVDSQIKGLEWLDAIPEPYQLHGEEALKRFLKHGKKKVRADWRTKARQKRISK